LNAGSAQGRLDPNDMITRMIDVIPASGGLFRNIHPEFIKDVLQTHQKEMFERKI
jgi:hypothetical protein